LIFSEAGERRQTESQSFTGSGLSDRDDVAAFQRGGDGLRLDRRGFGDTLRFQDPEALRVNR
jgi:hypothetical protein